MSSSEIAHLNEKVDTALRQTAEQRELIELLHKLYENTSKRLDLQSRQVDLLSDLVGLHMGLES